MNILSKDLHHLLMDGDLFEGLQVLLIIFSSFVSEDLTIVTTALLTASEAITPYVFLLGNFLGIVLGDMLLYGAGRGVVHLTSVSNSRKLQGLNRFIQQNPQYAVFLIFLARFIPGTRIPVYVSSGLVRFSLFWFTVVTVVSVAVWVWIFYTFNESLFNLLMLDAPSIPLVMLAIVIGYYFIIKVGGFVLQFLNPYSRRALYHSWKKYLYYEFWPGWMLYGPVALYYIWLGIKYRSLLYPSAVNPGIESGGLIGESKAQIFDLMKADALGMLKYRYVADTLTQSQKITVVKEFLNQEKLGYPFILKPDCGQRGSGVKLIHHEKDMIDYICNAEYPFIVQEYSSYKNEIGLFYIKDPDTGKSSLFSITHKIFPEIVGDGVSTLGELILADPRARIMAQTYLTRFETRMEEVLPQGERLRLVESGNHAQGTIFEDGQKFKDKDLLAVTRSIVRNIKGFQVGRLDIRYKTMKDLKAGKNFHIIEVNGAGSEATHIYDKDITLIQAYKTLFRQWEIMFALGKSNVEKGKGMCGFFKIAAKIIQYQIASASHPSAS